jgi:hypothetical protein
VICVYDKFLQLGEKLMGPLAGLFQVLLHWLLQKPCQTPNKIMASKLKPWRSHFAICTMEVKPKIGMRIGTKYEHPSENGM